MTNQLLPCWISLIIQLPRMAHHALHGHGCVVSPPGLCSLCRLSLKVYSIPTFQNPIQPFKTVMSNTHGANTTEAFTVWGSCSLGGLDLNPGSGIISGCALIS